MSNSISDGNAKTAPLAETSNAPAVEEKQQYLRALNAAKPNSDNTSQNTETTQFGVGTADSKTKPDKHSDIRENELARLGIKEQAGELSKKQETPEVIQKQGLSSNIRMLSRKALENSKGTTLDFLERYFSQSGKTLNLSDINLGKEFENAPSVKTATEKFMSETRASKDPSVKNTRVAYTNVTNDGDSDPFTPWPSLFCVGDSKLKMEGQCNESSCKFEFTLEDEFIDALDIHDKYEGNQDISTPYRIRHSWKVETPR